MNHLVDILFQLTVALKVPVIGALIVALGIALLELGGFMREWIDRQRMKGPWDAFMSRMFTETVHPVKVRRELSRMRHCPAIVMGFVDQANRHPNNPIYLEKVLNDMEIGVSRRCNLARTGIRLGPVLGLMGTLIPMGPALMSISNGDLERMAHNLVIAFSTTVVGLAIGALCLVILMVRQHWYAQDLADIDVLFQTLFLHNQPLMDQGHANPIQTGEKALPTIAAGGR